MLGYKLVQVELVKHARPFVRGGIDELELWVAETNGKASSVFVKGKNGKVSQYPIRQVRCLTWEPEVRDE